MAEKTFRLSQALDYLDNLEVSSDSEEESLGDFQSAKIYLQSPLNSNRPSSDVDSGDENRATADTSNLSGSQLLSSAVLEIKCPSGKVIVGQSKDVKEISSLIFLGKVKILRQKRLFKKQNSKRQTIHNM